MVTTLPSLAKERSTENNVLFYPTLATRTELLSDQEGFKGDVCLQTSTHKRQAGTLVLSDGLCTSGAGKM